MISLSNIGWLKFGFICKPSNATCLSQLTGSALFKIALHLLNKQKTIDWEDSMFEAVSVDCWARTDDGRQASPWPARWCPAGLSSSPRSLCTYTSNIQCIQLAPQSVRPAAGAQEGYLGVGGARAGPGQAAPEPPHQRRPEPAAHETVDKEVDRAVEHQHQVVQVGGGVHPARVAGILRSRH